LSDGIIIQVSALLQISSFGQFCTQLIYICVTVTFQHFDLLVRWQ